MTDSTTTPYDGKIIVNTMVGIGQSIARHLGIPVLVEEKTTLNEVLSILPQVQHTEDKIPVAKYLAIGNGGHKLDSDDTIPSFLPIPHGPGDQGYFSKLPLVLRPVALDLSAAERANYALRRQEEHGGKQYYAYYLKRIDHRGTEIKYYHTKVRDGNKTIIPYIFNDSNLYPQPVEIPYYPFDVDNLVVPVDGDYIHASATIQLVFGTFDIEELLNVAKVLYGSPNKAIVSELMLCTGVDYTHTGESAVGSPFTYNEAISVCVDTHMTTFENMALQNGGLTWNLEIGQGLPMLISSYDAG